MIASASSLFNADPGKITDFSGIGAGEIFNSTIVPRLENLLSESGLQALQQRQAQQQSQEPSADLFSQQSSPMTPPAAQAAPFAGLGGEEEEDYNAPIEAPQSQGVAQSPQQPVQQTPPASQHPPDTSQKSESANIKLSNYGYGSDSSPDHNSNVLRIGHSNNKLQDGLSAALTKSLASRMGLKTGDMFEAVADNGQVYKRRYDDTVPTTYKGKPLPETVDLYELGGKNSFGGKITSIKPLAAR